MPVHAASKAAAASAGSDTVPSDLYSTSSILVSVEAAMFEAAFCEKNALRGNARQIHS
jgi:hypothetical protein